MTDWQTVKLGDVAYEVSERVDNPSTSGYDRFVGLEHFISGDFRISKWGTTENLISAMKLFKAGDTLFARRNAYLKRVSMADFDGICSGDAIVLRNNEKMIDGFLPLILNTDHFWNYAIANAAGSMSKRVRVEDLMKYEFPLPPVDEQRRIADLLWAADDAISQHQEVENKLRQLWVSAASDYFSKTDGQKEYLLGDLLEYGSDGPFGSKLKTEHYTEDGVRVIRLQNIQENYFDDEDKAFISPKYYQDELIRYTVKPGDVLVAGLGDERIRAGRACIAPDYLGKAINKADCYCLRPKAMFDSNYLVAFLNSPFGLRQSESFAQGTTRFRLNLGNIKRMKVYLPDLKTQVAISEKLFEIQRATELEEQHIQKSMELKKQLLNKMLSA